MDIFTGEIMCRICLKIIRAGQGEPNKENELEIDEIRLAMN